MDQLEGKVAVVTGASTGIGLKISEALVQRGVHVAGLGRRRQKLEEAASSFSGARGRFLPVECDVSRDESVTEAFAKIRKELGSLHVLVNNAGMMGLGSLIDGELQMLRNIIDVNVLGFLYCSRAAVREMREANHGGHIVNIGSILGHHVMYIPDNHMNIYPATKFAVRALSHTLSNELLGTGIRVTHVSPGLVKTDFFEAAGMDPSLMGNVPALVPEDVADAVLYALGSKPHVDVTEVTVRHAETGYR